MSSDSSSSGSSSAASTPADAPNNKPALTEAQLLQRQADHARAAMSHVVGLIKQDLAGTINPAKLGRSHPIATVGFALAGGALVGMLLRKPKTDEPPPREVPMTPEHYAALYGEKPPKQKGVGALLLRQLLGAVGPLIATAAQQAMASLHPSPGGGSNGHAPAGAEAEPSPPPT
jgi:hypothetical protein